METQNTLKDKAAKKLEAWKSQVQHLNVQLHLGAMEAKDEFENQKKNISGWLNSAEDSLSKVKGVSEEKAKELKTAIEGLRVQAALGKAETEEKLKEQQKNLSSKINDLEGSLKTMYAASADKADELTEEASHKLDEFRTKLDLLKLQLHLGKEETKDKWAEKKKDLSLKLQQLDDSLEKGAHVASEKWDGFSTEIGEAWKHVKSAFKG